MNFVKFCVFRLLIKNKCKDNLRRIFKPFLWIFLMVFLFCLLFDFIWNILSDVWLLSNISVIWFTIIVVLFCFNFVQKDPFLFIVLRWDMKRNGIMHNILRNNWNLFQIKVGWGKQQKVSAMNIVKLSEIKRFLSIIVSK